MVLEPTTFRVEQALEYAVSLVRERAARHGISVSVGIGDDVDTARRGRAAVQAGAAQPAVQRRQVHPGRRQRATSRAERADDELVVTVTDTGVGVPPEDRERIFESFQQGGRGVAREEGTGLGLTLTRRIVELFDGRLWLESEVGVGSTFGFAVPAPAACRHREPSPEAPESARPTVLLVDDDRASLDLMVAYLEGVGAAPRAGHGRRRGAAARSRAAAGGSGARHPAPRLDGWQVLDRLREDPDTADIPIVVASVVDDRARGLALGAAAYLLKPVSRDDLLAALAGVGSRRARRSAPGSRRERRADPRGRGQPAQPQAGP